MASSAALTQYGVVYGGGAGAVPVATSNGTTGQACIATTSGAPSWGTLPVVGGGTGIGTTTAYSVVFSGTTATGPFQATAGPGTATHVLTSNGAGALPTFQVLPASGITAGKAIAFSMIFGL